MSKNSNDNAEPWVAWADGMQKMMANPAALNPFSGLGPFGAMMGMPGTGGVAGGAGGALDAASLMKAIDPQEIDRRIADMRAVETWLKFSLSTLEMSIKTMEMQRDAYASFQRMNEAAQSSAEQVRKTVKTASRGRAKNAK
jgi:predicted ATP-grasp superfamily ATP-dependent carboligase